MRALFAKCGINCARCPSYKRNLQSNEERQRCSEGWRRYLGFKLSPEKLRPCDGCQAPDDESPLRYQNCYVRKCAVKNGVETCAHCSAYPCEDVPRVSLGADYREERAARLGSPIPEEGYLTFIEPYEGMKHLELIRTSIGREGIVEMSRVSARPRIVDFPRGLPLSEEEMSGFRALHRVLEAMGSAEGVSYAGQARLKKRRRQLLKILWAFGLFGEPEEEGGPGLRIEGEVYLAQKMRSSYSRLKGLVKTLERHGVRCEHVPLKGKRWLTPGGALRKSGWYMNMSFDDEAGGRAALKALQKYSAALREEYAEGGFRYFSKADMRVLGKSRQSDT